MQSLAGERDQNCLVKTADGRRYVFKISNPSEPAAVVDFQIAALDHIARVSPEQPVPRVVRTLEGGTHGTIALRRAAADTRADADLPGRHPDPRDGADRRAATRDGHGLAGLNRALHGFTHPGATHDLLWNVAAAHRLTAKLDGIVDAQRRALAEAFMTRFTDACAAAPRVAAVAGDPQRLPPLQRAGRTRRSRAHRGHHRLRRHAACAAGRRSGDGRGLPHDRQRRSFRGAGAVRGGLSRGAAADRRRTGDRCRSHGNAPPHHGADLGMARRALPREPRLHHASQPRSVGGPVPDGGPFPRHGTRPAADRRTNWSHSNEKHDRPQHGQRLHPRPRRRGARHRGDDRAARRIARPGLPTDVRTPAAHRARRRRLADRPAGAPLSRRLQQRHVARALPSGGDRGDLPTGADAGDQYALPARHDSRAGGTPARERARRPGLRT